jgi:hypothetical protein
MCRCFGRPGGSAAFAELASELEMDYDSVVAKGLVTVTPINLMCDSH